MALVGVWLSRMLCLHTSGIRQARSNLRQTSRTREGSSPEFGIPTFTSPPDPQDMSFSMRDRADHLRDLLVRYRAKLISLSTNQIDSIAKASTIPPAQALVDPQECQSAEDGLRRRLRRVIRGLMTRRQQWHGNRLSRELRSRSSAMSSGLKDARSVRILHEYGLCVACSNRIPANC